MTRDYWFLRSALPLASQYFDVAKVLRHVIILPFEDGWQRQQQIGTSSSTSMRWLHRVECYDSYLAANFHFAAPIFQSAILP